MVRGFVKAEDFAPVIGWELYQVTIDKYHVMFWFENERQLLNVAHSFSHCSADGSVSYTYQLYGVSKRLELDRLLRRKVVGITVRARDRLALLFDNGDALIIHDDPEMCSWWFMPVSQEPSPPNPSAWSSWDAEP